MLLWNSALETWQNGRLTKTTRYGILNLWEDFSLIVKLLNPKGISVCVDMPLFFTVSGVKKWVSVSDCHDKWWVMCRKKNPNSQWTSSVKSLGVKTRNLLLNFLTCNINVQKHIASFFRNLSLMISIQEDFFSGPFDTLLFKHWKGHGNNICNKNSFLSFQIRDSKGFL